MEEREPPDEETPPPAEGDPGGLPPDPSEEEDGVEDPFESEPIRYSTEERVLGVDLDGPKVGKSTIDVFVLSEFLGQLDRVVRGLTAWARGIPLEPSGRLPSVPDAAPWRSQGVAFEHSATLKFVLGEPEATRISDRGEVSSPTIDAVGRLGHIIGLDASEAVEQLLEIDDRVGRDFTRLVALLADNELRSRWQALDRKPIAIPAERADRVRAVLRSEAEPVSSVVEINGFLFQLDAKKNDFRIQPAEGDAITGSYDDDLVDPLRDAWRRRVRAEVIRTERRYTFANNPHKVDHELKGIVERLEPVDE